MKKTKIYITIERLAILMAFIFLFSANLFAQEADDPKFEVRFKLIINGGDLKNALVTITKNGSSYRVIDPNGGKSTIQLELGAEYLFTCTKMGYISKSVVFDTQVPAGREVESFAKFFSSVTLYKQPEDAVVKYSQPVGRIRYEPKTGDFDYDKDYSATAEEMQKTAEAHPVAVPKPPTPNPRPVTEIKEAPKLPPSNPIPVVVKQPEYKPEPPKPKMVKVDPVIIPPKVNKNKEEKIIQEDRRKITLVTIKIDETEYLYKKEEYAWGGIYFYKDGKNITETTFNKDTE